LKYSSTVFGARFNRIARGIIVLRFRISLAPAARSCVTP
jgi:hypothetical protein